MIGNGTFNVTFGHRYKPNQSTKYRLCLQLREPGFRLLAKEERYIHSWVVTATVMIGVMGKMEAYINAK